MSWYESRGKDTSLAPISAEAGATRAGGFKSMYSDINFLPHITSDPDMGQENSVFFSLYAIISHIKPIQNMWYRACMTYNKKVSPAFEDALWVHFNCLGQRRRHQPAVCSQENSDWLYIMPWGLYKDVTNVKEKYGNPTRPQCFMSENNVYLAETIMLIFGMGLYSLFISNAFGVFTLKVTVRI
ncbi:Replication protein A DNA-binding subunit B [Zea mays]|uniref:Replication protein A DNA-binding subunit B n=1 Tax=Zea mays TaxID=4577 RepID=A0A3L6G6N3_MAIZE|nr:Replication protein A DNA-binding subunit B [Zea mays]